MYPSQTSLIPATVALLRYFNEQGFNAFSQNYPYWYLGTTPFKYLIGPVIPLVEYLFDSVFPSVSLFTFVTIFVILSLVLGGVGWLMLIKKIIGKENPVRFLYYVLLTTFFFLLPWKYFSGLALKEATNVIAQSMIPFVLVTVWVYLVKRTKRAMLFSSLGIAVLLLINTDVFLILIVGVVGICLTVSYKNGKFIRLDKKIKRSFIPLIIGFIVATLWYGPNFWWVQLRNPGIGGVGGFTVILNIIDFLKNLVPLALVGIILKFGHKIKDRLTILSLTWFTTFILLSLYRFMANPAFWMDWISWFTEVEIGVFLIVASKLQINNNRVQIKSIIFIIILLPIFATYLIYLRLGSPTLLSSKLPKSTTSLSLISKIESIDARLYLTGVNTFWINAFFNVAQVRGGRDSVANNTELLPFSYAFRESKDLDHITQGLTRLGISHVIINTPNSLDYYQDYKNLELWSSVGLPLGEVHGDLLLKINSR